MSKTNSPIFCALTDSELRERREIILQKVAAFLLDYQELENGFSYRFAAEDKLLHELAIVIELERKCCAFLNFKLVVEAQKGYFQLELTGEKGTKEMLESLFNWN